MELDKFWTEEISRAIEALKMRRVDPADFERWKSFHANLIQTVESWKVQHGFLFL
jgi:N-formylglutamate amidohydrolase